MCGTSFQIQCSQASRPPDKAPKAPKSAQINFANSSIFPPVKAPILGSLEFRSEQAPRLHSREPRATIMYEHVLFYAQSVGRETSFPPSFLRLRTGHVWGGTTFPPFPPPSLLPASWNCETGREAGGGPAAPLPPAKSLRLTFAVLHSPVPQDLVPRSFGTGECAVRLYVSLVVHSCPHPKVSFLDLRMGP